MNSVDAREFTASEHLRFANIFIRFSMCSLSSFHEIGEYAEVMCSCINWRSSLRFMGRLMSEPKV